MDTLNTIKDLATEHPYLASSVAIATIFIARRTFASKDPGIIPAPANTVVLYQIPRGPYAPSLSPFPLKLETYLRIAGIPYQNDFKSKMSTKGKTPWISHNGKPVCDSQFALEYLNSEYKVDLNQGLTTEQKILAHALRVMVDEHLYWCLVYFRWVYDRNQRTLCLCIPWVIRTVIGAFYVGPALRGQGIGRHSTQEIKAIMMQDLQVLEDQIGSQPFMLGERITELDCSVFGMLSQFVYHCSDDVTEGLVKEHFSSLYGYCERMKENVWPDWDDCTTRGGTSKPTK